MVSVKEFSSDILSFSQDGKVTLLEFNRPPANAMDYDTTKELYRAVNAINEDSSVNVVILTSALPKLFCGGADISEVEAHDVEQMDRLGVIFKNLFIAMRNSPKIFIAELAGHCLGGGLELALACDFRIGTPDTGKIGLPEVNLGLFPGGGAIQMVGRLAGQQKAFELAGTGQMISYEEAKEIGIIDYVFPREQLREETLLFASKFANGPSIAISNMKQAVYRGLAMGIEQAFDFERHMHKHLVVTEDCKEAVKAFKEKRKANFVGR
jgi:enoyl-CoA hydratase/carnithine racemase